jgi:hypothetical protein
MASPVLFFFPVFFSVIEQQGINRCNVFKLKPDSIGSGMLDQVI